MPQSKKDYSVATGKRKSAVARIRLYEHLPADLKWGETEIAKGEIYVNGKLMQEYFPSDIMKLTITEPLRIANVVNKYTYTIRVSGGGKAGQLDAVVAALSNVLAKLDTETIRPVLKKKGFLTRDSRIRERRKVGTGGKARRAKQSPKR